MAKKLFILTALGMASAIGAAAQDAQAALDAAAKELGVTNLGMIQYSGSGLNYAFGQAYSPSSPWPKFNVKTYTRTVDFDSGASRQSMVRTQGENPPKGGGQQPLVGEQTQNQIITVKQPWNQQFEIWITPQGFVKAALASKNATAKKENMGGKSYQAVTFTTEGKYKVTGYFNS